MTVLVTYTAYQKGSSAVVTEGTIPVQTSSSINAGEAVRAMYPGLDVVIRDTRTVR